MTEFDSIAAARRVIMTEADGLAMQAQLLGDDFVGAIEILQSNAGRTILTGVGKSGHVARKIAATMASTGTPALFVHPTEASHGDMGMILAGDCVIALSRSGETAELADLIAYCRRRSITLIAITANPASTLASAANFTLQLANAKEACDITGAPTTSTTLQMALGDALAVTLLEARGFTAGDFRGFHPGGSLGAKLARTADLMHRGDQMPLARGETAMDAVLDIMSAKGFGCVGIIDAADALIGIITDGDLRRNLGTDLSLKTAADIMTKDPHTAPPDLLAIDALTLMSAAPPRIMQLFITEEGRPIGILHMHDLLRAGIA